MDPSLMQGGLLAQALPVLLHKLANQTQLITGFHAIVRMDGGEALVEARSPDLTTAGHEVERVGWLLAALSSGAGHNLMLSRREPRGLLWMVELVHEILRKQGVEAAGFGQGLPRLTARAPEGWRLPWVLGCLLFEAYQDGSHAEHSWTLRRDPEGPWVLSLPAPSSRAQTFAERCQDLAGATWSLGDDGEGHLTLPSGWLTLERTCEG